VKFLLYINYGLFKGFKGIGHPHESIQLVIFERIFLFFYYLIDKNIIII
jgi:hypothetical protein